MKVILKEDINNLGQAGEVVDVKRGYANNYLLRRGLAVRANKVNLNELKTQQRAIEAKRAQNLAIAQEKAEKLSGKEFVIKVRTGEAGRLFGSVTTIQVQEVLAEAGYEVNRRDLSLADTVKEIGTYTANAKLHPEVDVDFVINVQDEDEQKQKALLAAKEAEQAKEKAEEAAAKEAADAAEIEKQIEDAVAESEENETEEAEASEEAEQEAEVTEE
ncbi:MAG: 50S ribosomal protein L9 [Clostridiaceae bacterium]|nr:50S ribosomal protein L9 [Clostridiaceae bacterium]